MRLTVPKQLHLCTLRHSREGRRCDCQPMYATRLWLTHISSAPHVSVRGRFDHQFGILLQLCIHDTTIQSHTEVYTCEGITLKYLGQAPVSSDTLT